MGERSRRRADMVDDDGSEDDEDSELQHRRDREHAERRKRAEQHQRDDCHRQADLEHRPPRLDAGEDDREHLVDDVRDRVRQVQEVRERPDCCLHECERASSGCFDEAREPGRRDDVAAETQPDEERRGVECCAEQGDQTGRAHIRGAGHVDHRERERPTDRRHGEPEKERRRETATRRRSHAGAYATSFHVDWSSIPPARGPS